MSVTFICGADCTGKSTLAEKLAECTRAQTTHGTPIHGLENVLFSAAGEKYLATLRAQIEVSSELNQDLIFDRHPIISDLIYNPTATFAQFKLTRKYLQNLCDTLDVNIIFLIDSCGEIIQERYRARGDEYKTLDEVLAANQKYSELGALLKMTGVPVGVIDIASMDEDINTMQEECMRHMCAAERMPLSEVKDTARAIKKVGTWGGNINE